MSHCPACGSTFICRIPRTPIMRLLVVGKRILCSHCGERSLILLPQRRKAVERPLVRAPQQRRQVV